MTSTLLKNKKATIPALIVALFMVFGVADRASAMAFSFYFADPGFFAQGNGNYWETCSGDVSTDKTTYSVGDTVTISGYLKSTNVSYLSSCKLYYSSNLSFLDVTVPLNLKSSQVNFSSSMSLAGLGMNAPGSYNLNFGVNSSSAAGSASFSVPITVSSPPPSVNLFFQ